jgi:hypothetical protein
MVLYAFFVLCLRILAWSRIPRYDLGRQITHFRCGSITSMESSFRSLDFPLRAINGIARREKWRNMHTKVIKKSLSDYAQED